MKNNNCIKEWQKQTIRDENMMKKKIIERGGGRNLKETERI